jgi:hypothetical protein
MTKKMFLVAHLADLELGFDALTLALRAEARPCFLVRQAFEDSVLEADRGSGQVPRAFDPLFRIRL